MLWSRRLAFVIGCALLASCGGGDSGGSAPPTGGGGGGGGGTPTPSPSPTPTYSTIAQLTGNQQFEAGCAFYSFSRQFSPNFRADSEIPFGERTQLRFDAAASTWSFVEGELTNPSQQTIFTFGPADLAASPPANTTLYRRVTAGRSLELALRNGQQTGFATEYLRTLLQTDIAAVGVADSDRADRLCVYGVPTVAADTLPAASTPYTSLNVLGTATRVGFGQRLGTFALTDSTATLAVNGQAGTVSMSIQLVGREILPDGSLAATTTALPALTAGTGTIANAGTPAIKLFEGNFVTGGIQDIVSKFSGAFFGPQGREAGFTFYARSQQNANGETFEIAGVVVARR
ncbi:MAG: hypothetical protein NBV68_00770 [Erythrobacter sp.]|uniref:hypothetical protein n=1 Tax=Erythrobacter sp. TaxID=1042 RepID=UPI0025DDD3B1|nr:hypothetical protein [Erythrobacter sp.]MCL9997890.1 hypothetical protein [Erythrobacter sp.]